MTPLTPMTPLTWISPLRLRPRILIDRLGLIPDFLYEDDPRPAALQMEERYAHGGGWHPLEGWAIDPEERLCYKGDRPLHCIAFARLRDEQIRVYENAWMVIIQPDGSYEVSRVD